MKTDHITTNTNTCAYVIIHSIRYYHFNVLVEMLSFVYMDKQCDGIVYEFKLHDAIQMESTQHHIRMVQTRSYLSSERCFSFLLSKVLCNCSTISSICFTEVFVLLFFRSHFPSRIKNSLHASIFCPVLCTHRFRTDCKKTSHK